MNIMSADDYQAKIEFGAELDMFRGEILGLQGGADFCGRTPEELRAEFRKSLQVFLEVCREKGIEPRRHYSGKFNIRIPPELHERLAILVQAEGKSLNTLAQEALQRVVEEEQPDVRAGVFGANPYEASACPQIHAL